MHKFSTFQNVLDEAVFKLPRGHKKLKSNKERIVGKVYDVIFTQKGKDIFVFVDGQETGPYKDLKDAESNVKDLVKLFKQMKAEGIDPMEGLVT
jgi:hypothetical protein